MAVELIKDTKEIRIKKDCQTCQLLKVCKFHSEMKKLTSSNEWYSMFEYAEWNNSLRAFEQHSGCKFYTYKFTYDLKDYKFVDPQIVSLVIRDSGITSHTVPQVDENWDGIVNIFPRGETFDFKKAIKKYKLYEPK